MTIAPETTATTVVRALQGAMRGEVDAGKRRRAEYSSDASNYRVPPQVVVFPLDADDLVVALNVAREQGVPATLRGGGTSVAGNAIGPGVVIDVSRHMNQILEIDVKGRTARVQPGVILSDLQAAVAPHGLRFGPDPSTSNRCTIGGMIGNNACGPHAVAYGRTADNVVALDVVDGAGRRFTVDAAQGADAVPGLKDIVADNLALIRTEFGRFERQVSGYSLEHLLPERGADVARFLVGTEGTLATTLEATLTLVEVAPVRLTMALGYADMPAAADAVVPIMAHKPDAVEGLDARLVERVRASAGNKTIPELPEGAGWLFIEVGAKTKAAATKTANAIIADSGALAHRIVDDPKEAAQLWSIRADGAGLSGRTPEGKEAWPGWEDAAVPPASLGAYLRDFDALMERHGVTGQPFGHFGDGCIHVRLDIPLEEDGRALRAFMEDAAALVAKHGGSLSGEHGDGRARSELLHTMYSPEAIALFGAVKNLFDPADALNPGVMVNPEPLDANLRRPHAPALPAKKGFQFHEHDGDITKAAHACTGVGKCRSDAIEHGSGFMCPSYQATKDEKDSTRARARVLQEAINGTLIGGLSAPELRDSLDLCLSCKACSSDCPSGVDMAMLKSEVLNTSYKGKLRPMMHYSIGWLPRWLKVTPYLAPLANAVLSVAWIQRIIVQIAGMDKRRTIPVFAGTPFNKSERARQRTTRTAAKTDKRVVLWADSFSNGLSPEIPDAYITVLEDAGFEVVIAEGDACCAVTWISTGQLDGAKKRLNGLLQTLGPFAINGVPIIGVEPSCTATLRSDLVELLPEDPRAHAVANGTFTLAEVLTGRTPVKPREGYTVPSLADVTAVVQPHCHQYSVMGYTADRELLASAGATVTEASGCCGLAGNWGTTKDHYDTAVAVGENSLLPALRDAAPGTIYLADGVSCRTQADDLADVQGEHLAQLLASRIAQ